MNRTLLLAGALALSFGAFSAHAQEPQRPSRPQVESDFSNLPTDVAPALTNGLVDALVNGNREQIGRALEAAIAAHPDLAVTIAEDAAIADPAAGAFIAGVATRAAMANNASATTAGDIAAGVAKADPQLAAAIGISVYDNLPTTLKTDADRQLIIADILPEIPLADAGVVTSSIDSGISNGGNLGGGQGFNSTPPSNPQAQGTGGTGGTPEQTSEISHS
jgi:hypothetical protein